MGFFNFADKFNNRQEDKNKRGFVDEDEWLVIQNDPEFKKALEYSLDKKTDSDSFDQWITSDKTWDSYMREPFDEYKESQISQISEENLPFDEQDITKTWAISAEKQKKKREQEKNDQEKIGEYSPEEFKFMEKCASFTHDFFVKNNKNISRPKFADGSFMELSQIKNQANEYRQFKNDNPEDFAEMKTMLGIWSKKTLDWKPTEYKGKKQWTAKQGRTFFVSQNNPDNFLKTSSGHCYFKERSTFKPEGKNVETVFIELQMPLEKAR